MKENKLIQTHFGNNKNLIQYERIKTTHFRIHVIHFTKIEETFKREETIEKEKKNLRMS